MSKMKLLLYGLTGANVVLAVVGTKVIIAARKKELKYEECVLAFNQASQSLENYVDAPDFDIERDAEGFAQKMIDEAKFLNIIHEEL